MLRKLAGVLTVVSVVAMTPACSRGSSAVSGLGAPSTDAPIEASAAPSPILSVKQPTVAPSSYAFPSDFKVTFPAYSGDGQEGVRAFGDFWNAFWFSASGRGADQRYSEYLGADSRMTGTRIFVDSVQDWVRDKARPTGTVRVYSLKTISVEPARVAMAACVDESRMGAKSLSSGEVDWAFGKRKTARYKMRIVMERTDAGGWLLTGYMSLPPSDAAAKECR